jgi:hypothetical protein
MTHKIDEVPGPNTMVCLIGVGEGVARTLIATLASEAETPGISPTKIAVHPARNTASDVNSKKY